MLPGAAAPVPTAAKPKKRRDTIVSAIPRKRRNTNFYFSKLLAFGDPAGG